MEVHSLNFSKILKKYLFSLIDEMGQNHALYTRNPNHDFSRIKKLVFFENPSLHSFDWRRIVKQ